MWPGNACTSGTMRVSRRAAAGAADSSAERDAYAGDLPLEGAEHEFTCAQEIEAGPIEVGQRLEKQRGQIGSVGEAIALAGVQTGQLFLQVAIKRRLGATGYACVD